MIEISFETSEAPLILKKARELGWEEVLFLNGGAQNRLKASLLKAKEIYKVKKMQGLTAFYAGEADEKEIRRAIEQGVDLIFGFEEVYEKDALHFRASGLNHVLCKLARQSGTIVAVSLSSISKPEKRALFIGRAVQNISLCKKYKVPLLISSFAKTQWELRAPNDLLSLGELLGLNPNEAREANKALLARALKVKNKQRI